MLPMPGRHEPASSTQHATGGARRASRLTTRLTGAALIAGVLAASPAAAAASAPVAFSRTLTLGSPGSNTLRIRGQAPTGTRVAINGPRVVLRRGAGRVAFHADRAIEMLDADRSTPAWQRAAADFYAEQRCSLCEVVAVGHLWGASQRGRLVAVLVPVTGTPAATIVPLVAPNTAASTRLLRAVARRPAALTLAVGGRALRDTSLLDRWPAAASALAELSDAATSADDYVADAVESDMSTTHESRLVWHGAANWASWDGYDGGPLEPTRLMRDGTLYSYSGVGLCWWPRQAEPPAAQLTPAWAVDRFSLVASFHGAASYAFQERGAFDVMAASFVDPLAWHVTLRTDEARKLPLALTSRQTGGATIHARFDYDSAPALRDAPTGDEICTDPSI